MKEQKPLIDGDYLVEKFPGKGGWTYVAVPEVMQNKKNPFGWRTVKGFVDKYELKQYKLMPMGNGQLFLPLKAEIRKKINKQAGDRVHIILYSDHSQVEIPAEIMSCFEQEDESQLTTFLALSEGNQKAYLDWIYEAKTDDTKVNRILTMMEKLKKNLGFYDKLNT